MIPRRSQNKDNSDGSISRASFNSKVKRGKIVLLVGCAFLFYNNALSEISQRQMRCAVSKLQGRKLSIETEDTSKNVSFKDYILRLLETEVDPCYTDYPPAAPDDVTYTADSAEANMEPDFTITDPNPVPPVGADGTYEVVPTSDEGTTEATMDENQKELLEVFPAETYDEDRALLEATTDDSGTVAYCVALTGCAEWYDPENSAIQSAPLLPDEGTSSTTTTATTDTTTTPTTEEGIATDTTTTPTTEEGIATDTTTTPTTEGTVTTTTTTTTTSTSTTPDQGAEVYEEAATLKTNICENNEIAVSRALKKTKNGWDTERKLATDLGYQMHALIHPMANTCPIEGTSGDTYDRTQLFQSQEYNVELLGHPIVDTMLYDSQPYIVENIESDVGIRDSMKLNIWKMTTHPIVVLMAFDTIQLNPITDEIDMLLADPVLKGYYISTPPDPSTGGQGVDTSFLVVKPSEEEFNNIVNAYVNTPFDPVSGWNGQGYHNFKGGMGISGFLAYYFANNPAYQELDRCRYGFNVDDACVQEIGDDFSAVNNAVSYENICGDPKKCPYDDPSLPPEALEFCHQLHTKVYTHRYKFEEKYFNKKNKQKRIGLFKQDTFLGYCREPGITGQLPLTGNVVDQPTWQTICPPEPCPEGTMMKSDCSCTAPENPCDACPDGTYCQTSPVLMCIDSKCGFCDSSEVECCEFNGINNSRSGPGNNEECSMQNHFFPAFEGSGNICVGVEIKRTAVPNGCGCRPQKGSPCTYNPDWASGDKKCFICNAADLAAGKCDTCKDCMSNCSAGACMNTSLTVDDFVNCMGGINDPECRSNCHFNCMKQ